MEENIFDLKKRANELRKAKNITEALPLYETLWKISGDSYDGAGLLHCLRKSQKYKQAIPLAEELIDKYGSENWIKIEVVWTWISGILDQMGEEAPLQDILFIAQKILNIKPESLAQKKTVFKVLKSAKKVGKWNIVLEWSEKLNPDLLSDIPMIINGKEGWSDQATWYNYKIRALIEMGDPQQALDILKTVIGKYPKNDKFFLRLKALALKQLNRVPEAEEIYRSLCQGKYPDWWLLHEYANVLVCSSDLSKKERSLIIMFEAASLARKLETCVNLYEDISSLCTELGRLEEARDHLQLSIFVRQNNGWNVSDEIKSKLVDLNKNVGESSQNQNLQQTLSLCKKHWSKTLGTATSKSQEYGKELQILKDLSGKLALGRSDRQYCFINTTNKKAVFCFKSDLPSGIQDGEEVLFDAVPSFDKKKNQQSWKAREVRRLNK